MKKLAILAALVLTSVSSWAAVATVNANNYDADKPIFFGTQGTAVTPAQNAMVQILGGPVGGPLAPLVIATPGGTATAFPVTDAGGFFDAGVVQLPASVAPNGQATFQIQAWIGGTSYDTATDRAQSAQWNQATGSWDPAAVPPAPATGPALNIPASLVLTPAGPAVPEPSTMALGLLGAAALLIRRRK